MQRALARAAERPSESLGRAAAMRLILARAVAAAIALAVFCVPSTALAANPAYTVTAIAQSGVTVGQAETLNDSGDVVGLATFPDSNTMTCGFYWHKGVVNELPGSFAYGNVTTAGCGGIAGGLATKAWDLNDSDLIAGAASFSYTDSQNLPAPVEDGASWQGTTSGPSDLGYNCGDGGIPGGSQALAVNGAGTFAGQATTNCGPSPVTSAWSGTPSNIIAAGSPTTGGKGNAYASAINSNGQVVVYYDGAGTGHVPPSASLYSNGTLTSLPVTPFNLINSSSARGGPDALNDDGVVVGSTSSHVPGFSQNGGAATTLTPADGDSEGVASAVNDSGDVVGASASGSGSSLTTTATLWEHAAPPATPSTEPTGVDLNTLIPSTADINLTSAVAVNASGQILAVGKSTTSGATEWVVLTRLIVTSTGDQPESNTAAPGVCDDGSGQCTLRAAITVANAASGPETIGFDIQGATGVPKISVGSPLPAITNAGTTIDGTTQPGTTTGHPGVQLDGATAGAGASGLDVTAANVTLKGLDVTGFTKDGIEIASSGSGATVQTSWIGVSPAGATAGNHEGIEVQASGVTVGGIGSGEGDVISGNGSVGPFQTAEAGLSQNNPSAAAAALTAAGGGVVADPATAASNLEIVGDWIGPKPDGADTGGYSNSVGVSLQGQLSGVAIGGSSSGAGDVLADNAIGIAALGSSVSGVTVEGNLIGPLPGDSTSGDTGNGLGIYAGQGAAGVTVGAAGAGNTFQDDGAGAVLANLTRPTVAANVFGADEAVPGDARSDLVGLALLDTTGAAVGAGNTLTGDQLALLVAGTHSSNNTITGNTIGRATDLGKSATQLDDGLMGSVFGVLLAGGSGNHVTGNTIQYAGLGIGIANSSSNSITSNKLIGNFYGVWAMAGGSNAIGEPGAGNTIERNDIGVLALDQNLPTKEQGLTDVPSTSDADQSARDQQLNVAADADVLAFASAVSSAPVGQSSVNVPTGAATGIAIEGNTIGGAGQGNNVGVVIGGGVAGAIVGGTAGADANTISSQHEAGVWVLGWPGAEPSAAILGNSIHDNNDGSIGGDVPGLGIDLAGTDANGNPAPANGFGVNAPNHSVQPDPNGPNGLQNYPLLSAASPSGGNVQVTGTLTSAPSQKYRVELFANAACSTSGSGEGEQLIGAQTVATDAAGQAAISDTVPLSLPGAKVITATATSLSGGPVQTSEFSPCQTIGGPPSFAGATGSGGTVNVNGNTATVTVTCPPGADASCVAELQLETTEQCTAVNMLKQCISNMGKAPDGTTAAHKRRRRRVTLILGSARATVAPGKKAAVKIRLSKTAQRLLAKERKLKATLVVTSHAGAGPSRTRKTGVTLKLATRRKHAHK